jgi:D-arabinose 5-phosphate isomerase GutQ
LTVEVGKEFQSAIEELIPDEQLRAVVITGMGKTGSIVRKTLSILTSDCL